MTPTQPTAQMFDTADAISEVLDDDPDHLWTRSSIFLRAGVRYATGGNRSVFMDTLRWMVENDYIKAEGNGAWEKYRARRAGERNVR